MFRGGRAGTVVIVTALDCEYDAVRRHLTNVRLQHHRTGTVFETGELIDSGRRIALTHAGQGNHPAAVLAERAIAEFQPVAILRVGTATALADGVACGDVVVGTKIYAVHGGAEDEDGLKARPVAAEAAHALEQLARIVARTSSCPVHFKPIAAGEVELGSRNARLAQQIDRHYNDAAVIEMDSAGVAAAAHRNNQLPMLTIVGITDGPESLSTAAANAAAFAADVLNELGSAPVERPAGAAMSMLDALALAVGQQWREDQERWSIHDPGRLEVRWQVQGGRSGRFDELGLFFTRLPAGRLVVLGRSGSGKTASASQLVLDLLALRAPDDPGPVLFSLGTWDPTRQRLSEWMIDQLLCAHPRLGGKVVATTGPKRTMAAVLVETGQILPVLDGLDELPEALRGQAIDAINRPGSDLALVITCRTAEYHTAVASAGSELIRAVVAELQPLDPADVGRYLLEGTGERWRTVVASLTQQPNGHLARALSTPLMVWLARVVHAKDPDKLCTGFADQLAVENHLLDHLIPAVYPDHPVPGVPVGRCTAQEAGHWLKFLARHLNDRPDLAWWRLDSAIPGLAALCRFVSGATMAMSLPLALGHGTLALVLGFVCGLLSTSRRYLAWAGVTDLLSPHTFRLTKQAFLRDLRLVLLMVPVGVLGIAGLGLGLALISLGTGRLWLSIAFLLAGAALLWWLMKLGRRRSSGTVTLIDLDRAVSASSTLRSDRLVALTGLVILTACTLPVGLLLGYRFAVPLAAGFGLAFFLSSAYFRFCAARVLLALGGRLPWRALTFLAGAADRGVLREVGAVYQFRHPRLKDRLNDHGVVAAGEVLPDRPAGSAR